MTTISISEEIFAETRISKIGDEKLKEIIEKERGQCYPIGENLVLCYLPNACHSNALLFSYRCKDVLVKIVEGLVVNEDGLAYEHFWNRIYSPGYEFEDIDITFDIIASEQTRKMPKRYFAVNVYTKEEMIKRMSLSNVFSDKVRLLVCDYYRKYPDKFKQYCSRKEILDH